MLKPAFGLNTNTGNVSTLFKSPKTKIGQLVDDFQNRTIQGSSSREEIVKRQVQTRRFTDFVSELEDSKTDIRNNPTRFVNNVHMLMYALA